MNQIDANRNWTLQELRGVSETEKKIDFLQLRDSEGRREIVLKVKYTLLVGTYLMCSNW